MRAEEDAEAEGDPFEVLGMPPLPDICDVADSALPRDEEVHSAFRRATPQCHPDKSGGSRAAFERLVCARDRALAALARARRGERGSSRDVGADHDVMWRPDGMPTGVGWAVYLAGEVVRRHATAKALEIDLDVSLADVYHARVKKVVLGVLRAGGDKPFERTQQTLYVRLLPHGPDGTLDVVRFPGAGDDPTALILLGGHASGFAEPLAKKLRGDVVVRIRMRPHKAFHRDPVLRACDLHATADVTLEGHYLGQRVELPHPSSKARPLVAQYEGRASASSELAAGEGGCGREIRDGRLPRQVCSFPGLGLPYSLEDGGTARGDAYVFLEVRLPELRTPLAPSVREALATLVGGTPAPCCAPSCPLDAR